MQNRTLTFVLNSKCCIIRKEKINQKWKFHDLFWISLEDIKQKNINFMY